MNNKLDEIVQRALVAGHCDWLQSNQLFEAVQEQKKYIKSLEDKLKNKDAKLIACCDVPSDNGSDTEDVSSK